MLPTCSNPCAVLVDVDAANHEHWQDMGPTGPAASSGATSIVSAAATMTPTLDFRTAQGRADFVRWALQDHTKLDDAGDLKPTGTKAMHWKKWGDGVDKGVRRPPTLHVHGLIWHRASCCPSPSYTLSATTK